METKISGGASLSLTSRTVPVALQDVDVDLDLERVAPDLQQPDAKRLVVVGPGPARQVGELADALEVLAAAPDGLGREQELAGARSVGDPNDLNLRAWHCPAADLLGLDLEAARDGSGRRQLDAVQDLLEQQPVGVLPANQTPF